MAWRYIIGVAVGMLVSSTAAQAASAPDAGRPFEPKPISEPLYGISAPSENPALQQHYIEASDGVELYLETWLPEEKDGNVPPLRIPTVLVITPYVVSPGDFESVATAEAVVPRGYAYAQLHVRGTGASQGCIGQISAQEVDDAARAIEYLGRDAPWSDGNVGGYGLSYAGGSIFAVAAEGDRDKIRYLKAIVVGSPPASLYDAQAFDGVPQFLEGVGIVPVQMRRSFPSSPGTVPSQLAERAPCFDRHLIAAAESFSGDYTAWHREREYRDSIGDVTAATLMFHGLVDVDIHQTNQVGLFDRIPDSTPKHGLFGIFGHAPPDDHRSLEHVQPDWERADWSDMVVAWFDRHLRGLPTDTEDWPVVELQGTGGQWRAAADWPATGGPDGQLALGADGALGVGDPSGSTSYRELEMENSLASVPGAGAIFETPPLPERLELAGQPVLDLWVKLDRPDAHVVAAIEALEPDGSPVPYGRTIGARSARHLEPLVDGRFEQAQGHDAPVGEPVHLTLRINPADIVVPAGGRLRVVLTGSRRAGPGLGELFGYFGVSDSPPDPTGIGQPTQPSGSFTGVTVLHDCQHPSVLRFSMPDAQPDLLNVREKDEPAGEPLADNRPYDPPVSDGGGLATAPVCGDPGRP